MVCRNNGGGTQLSERVRPVQAGGPMSALCGRRFIPPAGYWIVWPVLAFFVITADCLVWRYQEARKASERADPFSEVNLERWTASCLERKVRRRSCHVTFSFRYLEAPGYEQVGILGVTDDHSAHAKGRDGVMAGRRTAVPGDAELRG
jgi:hypothetical protein